MKNGGIVIVLLLAWAGLLFPAGAAEKDAQSQFEKGFYKEKGERDLQGAIEEYKKVVEAHRATRALAARAWIRIGECREKLGDPRGAEEAFRKVLVEFHKERAAVDQARKGLQRVAEKRGSAPEDPGSKPSIRPAKTLSPLEAKLSKKISLDFMDAPLGETLEFISSALNLNLVVDPNVFSERSEDELMVQLRVDDIPARQALNLILSMRDLSWAELHEVIYISTKKRLARYRVLRWTGLVKSALPDLAVLKVMKTKKVDWDFQDAGMAHVLSFLRTQTGIEFVLSDSAKVKTMDTTVTLQVTGLVLEQAFKLLMRFHELAYRVEGSKVVIYPVLKVRPGESPTEEQMRVYRALTSRRLSVDFEDTPFKAVLAFFRDVSRLNIVVSPAAEKVSAALPVSAKVDEVTLESMLRLLLMSRGLNYAVEGGVIKIDVRSGARGEFASRFGGRRNLRALGGGRRTESSVLLGLIWLKNHQDSSGMWSGKNFHRQCKGEGCKGASSDEGYDVGLTGLSLLAFLGAGHTPREGKFPKVCTRAVQALLARQAPDGCIGLTKKGSHWIYNHILGTLALCEAHGMMGSSSTLRPAVQKAVAFLLKAQNPGAGWRYGVRPGDNDTHCTAWAVMALKSAKISGFDVPEAAFDGARAWFNKVTDKSTLRVGYTTRGDAGARLAGATRFPPQGAMTAAATFARILMGADRASHEILEAGAQCKRNLPKWDVKGSTIDLIYWFFGAQTCFQLGGSFWKAWNPAMKCALVPTQRRQGCTTGSWDPVGAWGQAGGRIYATALSVLTLEIYYRFERMTGRGGSTGSGK